MGDGRPNRDGHLPDQPRRPWRRLAVGAAIAAVVAAAAGVAAAQSGHGSHGGAVAISFAGASTSGPSASANPAATATTDSGDPAGALAGSTTQSSAQTTQQPFSQTDPLGGSGGSGGSGGAGLTSQRQAQAPANPTPPALGPGPQSPPVEVTGQLSCLSGKSVTGVWVQAATGSGFASWKGIAAGQNSDYWYELPTSESYSLHVGCGGTTTTWAVSATTPTVSGAQNSFYCDDIASDSQYGTCVLR